MSDLITVCADQADELAKQDAELATLRARIEALEAALRPLACTCKAQHQAECSRSEVDCPFWNARAALEEKHD